MSNIKKSIIFLEDENLFNSISSSDLNSSELFSFNIKIHKFLELKKISHMIAENYLDKKDHEDIFKTTISLWNWNEDKSLNSNLNYLGLNILQILDTNELHQILVREITNFLIIKRILEKERPQKIICSKYFSEIIKILYEKNIELKILDDFDHDYLIVWEKILIRFNLFNLPISISISRMFYTRIKNLAELFIGTIFNLWFKSHNSKKSILFLEFNPSQYSELLDNLKSNAGDIIFLNRRRSATWNFDAIKTLRKFKCKIITPHKFLTKSEKKQSLIVSKKYLKELEQIWQNDKFFEKLFTIEGKSFWKTVKDVLFKIYQSRMVEYLELITFSRKFMDSAQISCILSLNTLGETEKSILEISKNKIPSILLEHAGTNYVSDISLYDISNMYTIFYDKIALWGNIQKNYLENIRKISNDKIFVTGSPRHDSFFNKQIDSHSNGGVILITPQVIEEYNAQTDTNTFLRMEELLRNLFLEIDKIKNVRIIVKMHPTQDPGNEYVKKLIHSIKPDIKIYQLEPILDIIDLCDTMININTEFFPSTVIYEGLIRNKPILNIYTMEKYYNFEFIKDNAMLNISYKDNLKNSLEKILLDKSFRNDLIKNGQIHLKNYFNSPGSASKNLADILRKY